MKRNEFLKLSGITLFGLMFIPLSLKGKNIPVNKNITTSDELDELLKAGKIVSHRTIELDKDLDLRLYPDVFISNCEFIKKKRWFHKEPNIIISLQGSGTFINNYIHL